MSNEMSQSFFGYLQVFALDKPEIFYAADDPTRLPRLRLSPDAKGSVTRVKDVHRLSRLVGIGQHLKAYRAHSEDKQNG